MKRPKLIGISVAGALALGALFSSRLIVFSYKTVPDERPASITIGMSPPEAKNVDLGDLPRGVLADGGPVAASPPSQDEPRIFLPAAEESDHNESADGEDYGMKGDSRDALPFIPGTEGGVKGRMPGNGPGANDSIGVGSGSGGSSRYGGRYGGRRAVVAGGAGTNEKPAPTAIEQAHKLATTDEERPRAPALTARLDGKTDEELPLRALRISTILMGTRARTLVDCTFENTSARQLEGTFRVRLPEGASPCYLGMFQGSPTTRDPLSLLPPVIEDPKLLLGREIALPASWPLKGASVEWGTLRPARVVAQERAAQVYEQVTRRRVDPALMEWSGGNNFSTRVFPIFPNGTKRVFFAYDQAPTEIGGQPSVRLPVPAKIPPAFRLEVAASAPAYAKATLVRGKEETPLLDMGGFFSGVVTSCGEEGAFVLTGMPRSRSIRSAIGDSEGIPGHLVHARVLPKVATGSQRATGDAVFLLDTSLSQRTKLAQSCGRLLREILEKDESIERFQVIGFDVTARPITTWVANTPGARAAAFSAVDNLWLEGATSIECALDAAEKAVPTGQHATFFLLSDAQVTWGIEDSHELERAHPRAFGERWIGYQIGEEAVNRPLLESLARRGGRVVNVLSSQDLAKAALAHRTVPVRVNDVRVEGVKARDLIVSGKPATLFPDQIVEVAFRTEDEPRNAMIVFDMDGGAQSFSLDSATASDPVAARAWAEAETVSLLELGDKDADQVAIAMSQRFGLANRAASFLILETDAEYKAFALDAAKLDLSNLAELIHAKKTRRPAGAPDTDGLDAAALAFLDRIMALELPAWPVHALTAKSGLLGRNQWPERLDPVAVYREAARRHEAGASDEAFRVLTSIVEDSPRDPKALRLAGFTLMSWERFADAASLFGRVRALRPFEPQAFLGEAYAFEALGRAPDAALRYELVLAGHFDGRHENYAKETARRLYGRLLARVPGKLAPLARERATALGCPIGLPAHEVHLLWNLDDTDVDLHCIDSSTGEHVDYTHMTSRSGGRLLWDNTAGLGPEVYLHPVAAPSEVFVHYFGTRAVAGTVPAATLIVYFRENDVICRSTVLVDQKDKVVLYSSVAER